MAQLTPALEFVRVTKTFEGSPPVDALRDVTVSIGRGEVFGIVGESGAGKSTFLHLSIGLSEPTQGAVRVLGTDLSDLTAAELRALRRRVGVVFQGNHLLHNLTAVKNIELPLRLAHQRDSARALQLLDFVGLADRAHSYPAELSGGQQQRIAIARALMTSPSIILFDEPTSALDVSTRHDMLELIRLTQREFDTTCVLVSHDLDAVKEVCDRAALFETGSLSEIVSVTPPTATERLPYLQQAKKRLGE